MLALGSVVIIKKKDNTLMDNKLVIVDRFMLEKKDSKEYFQYKGVVYPMGSYQGGQGVLFNDEHIGKVVLEGYKDEYDDEFIKLIENKFKEINIKKVEVKR